MANTKPDMDALLAAKMIQPKLDINYYHKLFSDTCWALKKMGDTPEMREKAKGVVDAISHSGIPPLAELIKKYFQTFQINID